MDKIKLLADLRQEIIDNSICFELASQANNLVMGEGNADAEFVFIGEAPGKKEDELGVPFVGASGKLLDQMLASIGISRPDVYITNIVKYRPPKNRDPSKEEKQAFLPYLVRQLEIIKPKVVVTLGRHSMEHFLPSSKISDVHGRAKKVKLKTKGNEFEITVLPLFHPAAALYNGSLRQTLLDDFTALSSAVSSPVD